MDRAKFDEYNLSINGIAQLCPFQEGNGCGLWCPKCYVRDKCNPNFTAIQQNRREVIGKEVVTCGQIVTLEEEK
jgi:hypothetical protein